MTAIQRLFMAKAAAAAIGVPPAPLSGQGGMASTMMRGMPGMGKARMMPKFFGGSSSLMKPMGPAAIGAPNMLPGGLTDKARPGLKV